MRDYWWENGGNKNGAYSLRYQEVARLKLQIYKQDIDKNSSSLISFRNFHLKKII